MVYNYFCWWGDLSYAKYLNFNVLISRVTELIAWIYHQIAGTGIGFFQKMFCLIQLLMFTLVTYFIFYNSLKAKSS